MPRRGSDRAVRDPEGPGPRPQPRDDPGAASDLGARAEAVCRSPWLTEVTGAHSGVITLRTSGKIASLLSAIKRINY